MPGLPIFNLDTAKLSFLQQKNSYNKAIVIISGHKPICGHPSMDV